MRLFTIPQIVQGVSHVVRKFPLECATAVLGTTAAVQLTYAHHNDDFYIKIILCSIVALAGFLAVTTSYHLRRAEKIRWLGYPIVALVTVLFYLNFSQHLQEGDALMFGFLAAAAHLLVASAAFIGAGSTYNFWHYNKLLFLRMVTAAIFSAALFAGLAGAIAAVDALFSFHVDSDWYPRIWFLVVGIFNTFFFLAGVPTSKEELEREQSYPKVLKIFTQYVLVPLVLLYLVILLSYEAKIAVQMYLPKGWVSNLIIAYGVVGILSILLVYPIRQEGGNNWINTFSKWFYLLLLPLVVLMFVAIGIRINEYGFTVERVVVLCLAIWLLFIALMFLWRPRRDIRIIPISLTIVAILLSFAAFPVAKYSQLHLLKKVLVRNSLLENGKLIPTKDPEKIPFQDRKSISNKIEYLLNMHGNSSVKSLVNQDSLSSHKYDTHQNTTRILDSLNLKYISTYDTENGQRDNEWIYLQADYAAIDVSGYDVMLQVNQDNRVEEYKGLHVEINDERNWAVFDDATQMTTWFNAKKFYNGLLAKHAGLRYRGTLPQAEMQQQLETDKYQMKLFYNRMEGYADTTKDDAGFSYHGYLLLKKKTP